MIEFSGQILLPWNAMQERALDSREGTSNWPIYANGITEAGFSDIRVFDDASSGPLH